MGNINVAELLKDCPQGMELDCTTFDTKVTYKGIIERIPGYPIAVQTEHGFEFELTQYGQLHNIVGAKCIILPKGKTTWEGFHRPFKDGDIIFTHTGDYDWVSIFKQFKGNSCCTHIDVCINDNDLIIDTQCLCNIGDINIQRLATEEEKQKLFDVVKAKGYRWNPETKTCEKLIEPKFKVGDKIKHKTHIRQGDIVTEIKDTHYILNDEIALPFTFQDEYELIPNKFNINTLVPFESKVLVRDKESHKWRPATWGFYNEDGCDYHYIVIGGQIYRYCIPYEGNEHLLGTTNDCDEFYKTW